MDLSNSFAALDPQNPGFIGLDSESEMDSVSNGRRDDVQNIRGDAMEIDEDIGDEQMNHQHTQNVVFPFSQFVRHFDNCTLPGDIPAKGSLDHRHSFVLGDPGVDYEGTQRCEYEVSGARGEPHWDRIFGYLLQHFGHIRFFQTAFVLVDNRDLTAPVTEQDSLAHWPTVAAWWASRLSLHGPACELCDLIFVPIGPEAGLEHVHPTWAGTFVLSALVFLFPGIHFVLLDSDCVPVTLFEVEDLWKELSLIRDGLTPLMTSSSRGQSTGASDESVPKASKLSHNQWKHQTIGQGILLVTEHNAEINAGFIVAFASSHTSVVSEQRWRDLLRALDQDVNNDLLTGEATRVTECYWQYIGDFLSTCRPESAVWIQTGLALTPLAGCVIQHTCDWTVAWSLIGEWTSQEIFLPPAGDWPRNGHSMNLVDDFDDRRPCLLTWARACFEQGSLPSMLHLGGSALLGVLPGDKMFQAQRLNPRFSRPAILHGYGGAKREIPHTLPGLAKVGSPLLMLWWDTLTSCRYGAKKTCAL